MTKILVIEDDAGLREDILTRLTDEGYDVTGATDGIEGVSAAFRNPPDLIICDINMPRLDGFGVLSAIQSNTMTRLIPFIFLTARASLEDLRKGMAFGADDYLTKPFEHIDLLHAISTRLEKQAAQELAQQQEIALFKAMLEDERSQRLLQIKLVAMFSHDFRNSLAVLRSSGALLHHYAHRLTENQVATHWSYIESAVQQLSQMLDDMLFIAQMESGRLTFKPEPLDIARLLQTMIDEFGSIHGESYPIAFECTLHEPILIDARLMRQIAANLISNAIKYSPQGGEIRIAFHRHQDRYILTVEDQGIGIPEADQLRLFDAFQRASNAGQITGTGLGLAIVKQAAVLHGGTVQLESQVNVGTRVTVRLPQNT